MTYQEEKILELVTNYYRAGQASIAVKLKKFISKLQRDKVKPELWPGLITDFCDRFVIAPWENYKPVLSEEGLGMPKEKTN